MEERDRIRYETLFYCQKLEDGFLSGDNARALFIRSKLPLVDLTRIWKLADITRDNKLDVFEFSLAMHFIELKMIGGEIPKQNDISNVEISQEVVVPIITLEEKQQIKDVFDDADKNCQGFLELDIMKPMLLSSGLSSSTLSKIWNIADLNKAGRLCLFEFTIAMHLLKNCVKGLTLNGPVNPFACVPDEDNTVDLYKEKLATFDKEFLLRQKNTENKLTLDSTDHADHAADFELLICYLFDGPNVSPSGKTELDPVDENRNVFHNHAFNGSQDCESIVNVRPHQDCTETIECNKINTSELDIDLENLFETVSKENMGENGDAPKFTARLPVGFAETDEEEEEISAGLPYFQRRTYFGKDLIFEDPIGSELIGDVEFEVDFHYIINDIEKDMMDEERRLPIARVLPIYKTPPVLDEQSHENSVTTKGGRDVDLNSIDEKTVVSNEQENHGLNNRDVVTGTATKESRVPHQGVIITDESTSYKLFSHEKNAERPDSITGTVDDIVEQKRLLLQNKQEERRKFLEDRHNVTVNQQSFYDSTSVVVNAEQINDKDTYSSSQEKDAKRKNILNNFSAVQSEGAQSICKKEDVAAVSSNPEEGSYMNEIKANENMDYNKSNNENIYEEEEEKKRLREAEEKEKLLLERIMFLERKRQKLYEKKQRKLNSNKYNGEHKVYVNQEDTESNQLAAQTEKNFRKPSTEAWSSHSKQRPKETNEEEKRRLAEALAAKRKTEAELERQREEAKRAAEERRLEEEAKQREEQEAAKERKRNFMENLQRLKQRVLTEEEEKSKGSKSQTKHEPIRTVHSAGRFSPILTSSTKSQSLPGFTKEPDRSAEAASSNTMKTNVRPSQTTSSQYEVNVDSNKENGNDKIKPDEKPGNEEDQKKADEMRRENFQSNRELFMKKIQADAEQNVQVKRREKNKKIRPKSYYGGMFNKPVHQIVDDSLLAQNLDSASSGDLVDEEALKQFQREKELKEEHEKVNKLRSNLERESSYTVENVEQLFCESDTESKKKTGSDWDNLQKEETKVSSHLHRRSLVNTLTTEWNSFLDILEDDKRRESETVKMREEISAQRKGSVAQTSVTTQASIATPVDVVKSDISKDVLEETEIFSKQAGKVRKLVTSYKRSSATYFLNQDFSDFEKTEEGYKILEKNLQEKSSSKLPGHKTDDKTFQQKNLIKENAPRRKTDLAHAWTHMISNQPNSNE